MRLGPSLTCWAWNKRSSSRSRLRTWKPQLGAEAALWVPRHRISRSRPVEKDFDGCANRSHGTEGSCAAVFIIGYQSAQHEPEQLAAVVWFACVCALDNGFGRLGKKLDELADCRKRQQNSGLRLLLPRQLHPNYRVLSTILHNFASRTGKPACINRIDLGESRGETSGDMSSECGAWLKKTNQKNTKDVTGRVGLMKRGLADLMLSYAGERV